MQIQTSPLILTFGVSDPVGAIGIQADLATFSALACHGLSVSTALLISDTARVEESHEVEPDWVYDQARVLLEDMTVAAIKIGAVGGVEHITAIAEIVSDYPTVPLILDPFISSLPEQGLAGPDMLTALRQLLIPQTTLLMLSQAELERLAETWRDSDTGDTLLADIAHLIELGCVYVLVTGTPDGHPALRANTLFGADGILSHEPWQHLAGAFIGAGGLLSAAITALLARQSASRDALPEPVCSALDTAQQYTAGALRHAQRFGMGRLVPNRFFQHNAH